MFRRKANRLDPALYRGIRAYFVTVCTNDHQEVFTRSETVRAHLELLKSFCKREAFSIWAYCFMPDHVHLMLIGQENSDLMRFIRAYKQRSGYQFKQATGKTLWQKSFYDHILRKEENIPQVIRYVLENPIRNGVVASATKYPFSGSFEFGREVFKL